jgi:DNA-binding transcriptional LysR family regulator
VEQSADILPFRQAPEGVEVRHLRAFVAVAEELNFSRAAERLHIAQPALSAQIRTLETQLGCELFVRTTRKVELTPAGEMLVEDAREIVARADEAAAKLLAVGRGRRGLLRIGFVAQGAGETSTEIFRRFAAEFPAVETELVECATLEETQRRVRDHELDLGFAWMPILYEELLTDPILSERKLIAMHPEHPLAGKRALTASDLESEPIVAPWDHLPEEMLDFWFTPFRNSGRLPADPNAKSADECLSFVSRGIALYCVPESVQRFYPRPDVVFRPIMDVAPAQVVLAWNREARNPAVASFVELARRVVREGPGDAVAIQSGSH